MLPAYTESTPTPSVLFTASNSLAVYDTTVASRFNVRNVLQVPGLVT